VGIVNSILTGAFDLVLRPFGGLAPIWGLTAVSVATGVAMLWVFGKVSNQEAIRLVRDRIRGNLIAIRLFGDDLAILARLQGRILRHTLTYLRYSFVPMLVLLVPVLLILVQLNLRFAARPLRPGEPTLVKVQLHDGWSVEDPPVELEVPRGVRVETPGVRIPSLGEVAWRIRAEEPGVHRLVVRAGPEAVDKELVVASSGSRWRTVSSVRTGASLLQVLLHPAEPPLSGDLRIESIEVRYPSLALRLFGWNLNAFPSGWLAFFFVASIASGFALRRVLGVEI
jgi:uncharacterized membrane protein (DUF106 family)